MAPCKSCVTAGRAGSCARLRCYCGHEGCWAFDSWVPLTRRESAASAPANTDAIRASWDARDGETWLDRM